MFEQLRKRPGFANCATEADVMRHIDTLEIQAARVPGLEQKVTTFENAAREALEAEDDALLDTAQDEGRIQPSHRPVYKAILNADRENGRKALAELKPAKRVVDVLSQPDPHAVSAWDERKKEIEKNYQNRK